MEFSIKLRLTSSEAANKFLLKMIAIIPYLKNVDHRRLISEELIRDCESEGRLIGKTTAQIVSSINTTIKDSISK